jgi:hypothetical protein
MVVNSVDLFFSTTTTQYFIFGMAWQASHAGTSLSSAEPP